MSAEPQIWPRLRQRLWTTPSLFLLFVGIVLLALGTVLSDLPHAVASPRWPRTDGLVTTSEVRATGTSTDNEGYCPSVSYSYLVDGKLYTSDNVELMFLCSRTHPAAQVVQRYPAGKRVDVYYDPQDPAFAVLEPGIPDNDVFLLVLIVASISAGALLFAFALLVISGVVALPRRALPPARG